MDYHEGRLTVYLDAAGKVERANCGYTSSISGFAPSIARQLEHAPLDRFGIKLAGTSGDPTGHYAGPSRAMLVLRSVAPRYLPLRRWAKRAHALPMTGRALPRALRARRQLPGRIPRRRQTLLHGAAPGPRSRRESIPTQLPCSARSTARSARKSGCAFQAMSPSKHVASLSRRISPARRGTAGPSTDRASFRGHRTAPGSPTSRRRRSAGPRPGGSVEITIEKPFAQAERRHIHFLGPRTSIIASRMATTAVRRDSNLAAICA